MIEKTDLDNLFALNLVYQTLWIALFNESTGFSWLLSQTEN